MRSIKHFISEPIDVQFIELPEHSKKPPCPNGFTWQDQYILIINCLAEWKDFSRRGRMAKNMQPQHAQVAHHRGSWGVGKFYFDVQTEDKKCFRIYYDREPKNAEDRSGHWFLLAELEEVEG